MIEEEIIEQFPEQFYCPLCAEWIDRSAILFHHEHQHPINLPNGEHAKVTWESLYERMKGIGYI